MLRLTVERNAELAKLGSEQALSLEEVEPAVAKNLALYAALELQVRCAALRCGFHVHTCMHAWLYPPPP